MRIRIPRNDQHAENERLREREKCSKMCIESSNKMSNRKENESMHRSNKYTHNGT